MELEIGGSLAVQVHSSFSFVTVSAVKQSQSIKAICESVQSFAPTAETVDLMLVILFCDFLEIFSRAHIVDIIMGLPEQESGLQLNSIVGFNGYQWKNQ